MAKNSRGRTVKITALVRMAAFKRGWADCMAGRPMAEEWDMPPCRGWKTAWVYERGRLAAAWVRATRETAPAKINGIDVRTLANVYRAAKDADALI